MLHTVMPSELSFSGDWESFSNVEPVLELRHARLLY